MTSNEVFQFLPTSDGTPTAQTQAMVRFKQPTTQTTQPAATREPRRVQTALIKRDGEWRLLGMELFRKPAP
jgi:hypothetical protein